MWILVYTTGTDNYQTGIALIIHVHINNNDIPEVEYKDLYISNALVHGFNGFLSILYDKIGGTVADY